MNTPNMFQTRHHRSWDLPRKDEVNIHRTSHDPHEPSRLSTNWLREETAGSKQEVEGACQSGDALRCSLLVTLNYRLVEKPLSPVLTPTNFLYMFETPSSVEV